MLGSEPLFQHSQTNRQCSTANASCTQQVGSVVLICVFTAMILCINDLWKVILCHSDATIAALWIRHIAHLLNQHLWLSIWNLCEHVLFFSSFTIPFTFHTSVLCYCTECFLQSLVKTVVLYNASHCWPSLQTTVGSRRRYLGWCSGTNLTVVASLVAFLRCKLHTFSKHCNDHDQSAFATLKCWIKNGNKVPPFHNNVHTTSMYDIQYMHNMLFLLTSQKSWKKKNLNVSKTDTWLSNVFLNLVEI